MSIERLRARADRVKEEADLGEMLSEWGYSVVPDRQREQQFSCDLHGPDNKPSARYYGTSNSTYCWVCQQTRDAIAWMMEKEFMGFREAVEHLEERCGLETLPWDDEQERVITPEDELESSMSEGGAKSYEEEGEKVRRLLQDLTDDQDLECQNLLAFWEVLDRISYGVAKQNWGEDKGVAAVVILRKRVMEAIRVFEEAR